VADAPAPAGSRPKARWAARAVLVVLLVVLALAGVGGWRFVWQPLQAQLADHAQRLAAYGQRLDALEVWEGMASEDLAAFESRLRALSQRVDQLGPERLSAWSLAEADHLLRSAARATAFDYDPVRAALALRLASATLGPVAGTGEVRRAIDRARAALEEARVPDVGALGSELVQAGQTLRSAGLREPGVAPMPVATPGWRGTVQQVWQQLSEVIVVQRTGAPVQPLLRPQEAEYLRQQLALKLTAAELALRRRDSDVFRRDMTDLRDWAEAYLDTRPPETAAALATLTRLADIELRPALPELSGLGGQLDALRRQNATDRTP
jgi:uroporphyrin-3 C-methyltransferase